MEPTAQLVFRVPCEIIEFELEVIPEGISPEMEALTLLLDKVGYQSEEHQIPLASKVRMIRKGYVNEPLLNHQLNRVPIPSDLSAKELVDYFRTQRKIERCTLRVVRDLHFGTVSNARLHSHEQGNSLDKVEIDVESLRTPFQELKKDNMNFMRIIEPHQRELSYMLDVDYHDVPKRINLVGEVKVTDAVLERRFFQRKNKHGQMAWISTNTRFDAVSNQLRTNHPMLSKRKEEQGLELEWKPPRLATMLEDLNHCTSLLSSKKPKWSEELQRKTPQLSKMLMDFHHDYVQKPNVRLKSALPVVGTEEQQWDAAKRVISSAKENVMILSAFTNDLFVDDVKAKIESSRPNGVKMTLASGEPNRVNEQDYVTKTEKYEKRLGHNVVTTLLPSHAKFVISDTGKFWLGSCNLLSSATGSQNSEVGVLIQDVNATSELLDLVLPWFRNQEQEIIHQMKEILGKQKSETEPVPKHLLSCAENLREFTNSDGSFNKEEQKILLEQINLARSSLYALMRRPNYHFLKTEEHRSFLIDTIAGSKHSIALASDQLRPTGLDPTLRNIILGKYTPAHPNHLDFQTRLYWGRQWEHSKNLEDDVKEGQILLDRLRKKCVGEIRRNGTTKREKYEVRFFPRHTKGPMNNHAKFLVADGLRVLVTSLNVFGGKNEELDVVDATELGIIIDCDRLAHTIVGEMDLMMGIEYINRSIRQLRQMFQAVLHTSLMDLNCECTVEALVAEFFSRVFDTEHLSNLWHDFMSKRKAEVSLLQVFDLLHDMKHFFEVSEHGEVKEEISIKKLKRLAKKEGLDFDLTRHHIRYRKTTNKQDEHQGE